MTSSTAAENTEHYVKRLDLGEDPFAADFVSDYYFSTPERHQLLDQVIHFSRYSDQLVLLVGAVGSGTSTLLEQAIQQLREVMDCCYVNANEFMNPDEVLASLCQQLHLRLDEPLDSSDFLQGLRDLVQVDDDIEPILLAVDQAQFLSLEGYQLLHNIVSGSGDMVKLLLVGEYQIEHLAKLANFDPDQSRLIELTSLDKIETEQYLLGLLQSVGYAGETPFSADQMAVLYEQSAGNYAEINQLAPALLSSAPPKPAAGIKLGLPIAHVVTAVFIGAVLITAWLYQDPEIPEPVKRVSVAAPITSLVPDDNPEADKRQGAIERASQSAARSLTTDPLTESAMQPVKPTTAPLTVSAKQPIKPVTKSVVGSDKSAVASVPPKQPASVADSVKPVAPKVAPETTVAVPPVSKVAKKVPPSTPASPLKKAPAPKTTTARSQPVMNSVKTSQPSVREQRLLSLAGTEYMLQLMGANDLQRTERLVMRYAGRLPVTYYETRHQGKPWYVAVAGPYSDKAEAVAVVKSLPAELQQLQPWARSLAGIQKDIRAKQR